MEKEKSNEELTNQRASENLFSAVASNCTTDEKISQSNGVSEASSSKNVEVTGDIPNSGVTDEMVSRETMTYERSVATDRHVQEEELNEDQEFYAQFQQSEKDVVEKYKDCVCYSIEKLGDDYLVTISTSSESRTLRVESKLFEDIFKMSSNASRNHPIDCPISLIGTGSFHQSHVTFNYIDGIMKEHESYLKNMEESRVKTSGSPVDGSLLRNVELSETEQPNEYLKNQENMTPSSRNVDGMFQHANHTSKPVIQPSAWTDCFPPLPLKSPDLLTAQFRNNCKLEPNQVLGTNSAVGPANIFSAVSNQGIGKSELNLWEHGKNSSMHTACSKHNLASNTNLSKNTARMRTETAHTAMVGSNWQSQSPVNMTEPNNYRRSYSEVASSFTTLINTTEPNVNLRSYNQVPSRNTILTNMTKTNVNRRSCNQVAPRNTILRNRTEPNVYRGSYNQVAPRNTILTNRTEPNVNHRSYRPVAYNNIFPTGSTLQLFPVPYNANTMAYNYVLPFFPLVENTRGSIGNWDQRVQNQMTLPSSQNATANRPDCDTEDDSSSHLTCDPREIKRK